MVYVLTFPRPIGTEAVIYRSKPDLSGFEEECNSMWTPSVEEFHTEFEARLFILTYRGKVPVEIKD